MVGEVRRVVDGRRQGAGDVRRMADVVWRMVGEVKRWLDGRRQEAGEARWAVDGGW